MIELRPLEREDLETVRLWRNDVPETLRTPFDLNSVMQADYFDRVICNRESRTRYWGLWGDGIPREVDTERRIPMGFAGYGGIENIAWENRSGEISLLIGPDYRRQGMGSEAAELILEMAFARLNLYVVHGECYHSSPAVRFWERIVEKHNGFSVDLPDRKYYAGRYWDSLYFSIKRPSIEDVGILGVE